MRLNAQASRRFGRGDYTGAAECYQQLTAADPRDSFALFMLTQCHERQGRHAEALATAMKAVALDPGDYMALRSMASACVNTGDPHTAKLYVERALAAKPPTMSGREVRFLIGFSRVVVAILRLVPRYRKRVRPLASADFDLKPDAREWRTWAHKYLAWYADTFPDSGPSVN